MKKSTKCLSLLAAVSLLVFSGCQSTKQKITKGKTVINVWSMNEEVPLIVINYFNEHPELKCYVAPTILPYQDGSYQAALDKALKNHDKNSPDIYAVELSHALKYTKGSMQNYVMPFKEVFGTDNPEEINEIIGGATGKWDKFLAAAEMLKNNGYAIASGVGDVWHSYESNTEKGWVVDGKLYIDPSRKEFMEIAKQMVENHWINDTYEWSNEWYDDIKGISDTPVFGFFGPSWFINYTLASSCGNAYPDGDFSDGVKDSVASRAVMEKINYEFPVLGNQNICEYLIAADELASVSHITDYDSAINGCWLNYVRKYARKEISLSDALKEFEAEVNSMYGFGR